MVFRTLFIISDIKYAQNFPIKTQPMLKHFDNDISTNQKVHHTLVQMIFWTFSLKDTAMELLTEWYAGNQHQLGN